MKRDMGFRNVLSAAQTWIVASISVLTLLVGVVSLLRAKLYLAVVLAAMILFGVILWLCVFAAFARVKSQVIGGEDVFRFKTLRFAGWLGMVTLITLAACTLGYEPWRSFVARALLDEHGETHVGKQIAIAQLQVGTAPAEFAVDIVLRNSLEKPALVTHVLVEGLNRYAMRFCCCPAATTYQIGDSLTVKSSGGRYLIVRGDVHVADDVLHNFALSGFFYDNNCNGRQIRLEFEASITLPARSYTSIRVTIPRGVRATTEDDHVVQLPELGRWDFVLVSCILDYGVMVTAQHGRIPRYTQPVNLRRWGGFGVPLTPSSLGRVIP
ncbi:MAG: hypothetical protein JWO56_3243 [Acidobacteria bacterium]|nr:hypothetical protein [Acidobacteriota bacterium]